MRVIMHEAKEESAESVKIIQEQDWVMNFLKSKMITLEKVSASSNPSEYGQTKNDLNEFANNPRNHFKEDEQVVFPLALTRQCSIQLSVIFSHYCANHKVIYKSIAKICLRYYICFADYADQF